MGDKWLEFWQAIRAKDFEPKFEVLLNKQLSSRKTVLTAGKNPEARYTMVLKTTHLEPGWSSVIMRSNAEVNIRAEFYETKDRSKSLAVITVLKAPGRIIMGYDLGVTYRLEQAYAKTGKELGAFLSKRALK